MTHADSLLESRPLSVLAQGQKCDQSEINGERSKALLDNSMQINTITPNYVKNHSLVMGLITDLIGTRVTCVVWEMPIHNP